MLALDLARPDDIVGERVQMRCAAQVEADSVHLAQEAALVPQDLYYRVARFTVEVPPLRNRREDIPLLAQHFLELFAGEMRMGAPVLSPEAVQKLTDHDYPGNIRELKNVVGRALIESRGGDIGPEHLQLGVSRAPHAPPVTVQAAIDALPLNFSEVEAGLMARALRETDGSVL